jgi:hypothetical protein
MEGKADQEFIWGAAMGPVHRQEKMIIGWLSYNLYVYHFE